VFNILNYTSVLEDSCFYSSVPSEVVTIPSFPSLCSLVNGKV